MPALLKIIATILLGLAASLLANPAYSGNTPTTGIFINGSELTPQQVLILRQTAGLNLPPGHYLVQDGCVLHVESGLSNCAPPAQAGMYGDDDEAYDDDVYEFDAGEYAAGSPYGGGGYSYGAQGYGYGAGVYGNGSNLYNDGTYTYSYGNDGYSYQGGVGGGYGYNNQSDGSWFHRGSDYSGGYSVGSDSNGCIYTPNWSNC